MKKNSTILKIKNSRIVANFNTINGIEFLQNFEQSICKLFTFEVDRPRIIILKNYKIIKKYQKNIEKNLKKCLKIGKKLEKILKINHTIAVMNTCSYDDFFKIVHYCEFDLGLVFGFKKDIFEIVFISGTGKVLSQTKFSIIENQFKNKITSFGIKKINVKNPFSKSIVNFQTKQQMDKFNNHKNLLNNL